MGTQRRIALLGLCVVSLTMMVGSGAFTSTSAERPVSVNVVDDDRAYLGVGDTVRCGVGNGVGNNKNVVTNRFATTTLDPVTVRLSVAGDGALRVSDSPGASGSSNENGAGGPFETIDANSSVEFTYTLAPGEGATVQIQPPTGNTTAADSIHLKIVEAGGDGVDISTDERTLNVRCPAGQDSKEGNSGDKNDKE